MEYVSVLKSVPSCRISYLGYAFSSDDIKKIAPNAVSPKATIPTNAVINLCLILYFLTVGESPKISSAKPRATVSSGVNIVSKFKSSFKTILISSFLVSNFLEKV